LANTEYTPPNASAHRATIASQSDALVTSPTLISHRPPADSISARSDSRRSARRALATTGMPARAHASAVARPIPLDAPVMQIGFPLRSILAMTRILHARDHTIPASTSSTSIACPSSRPCDHATFPSDPITTVPRALTFRSGK
jgi:hypothetical protein